MGYELSMIAETLQDQKPTNLQRDMKILVANFVLSMVFVAVDVVTYGDAKTINSLSTGRCSRASTCSLKYNTMPTFQCVHCNSRYNDYGGGDLGYWIIEIVQHIQIPA